MKYSDRTKAKNKYKKMLLMTSAALTLGLGIVGSTSIAPKSAYAYTDLELAGVKAEQKADLAQKLQNLDEMLKVAQQKQGVNGMIAGYNSFMESGGQKAIDSIGAIAPVIFDAIKQQKSGPVTDEMLNRIAKNLTLTGLSMIPYVGGLASSIVGMIWPSASSNPLQELETRLTQLVNDTVTNSEKNAMQGELTTALDNMDKLDKMIKNEEQAKVSGVQHSPAYAGAYIVNINTALNAILNKIAGSQFKADELPLYATVATVHLTFLKFIEANKKNPELGMSDADYNSVMTNSGKNLRDLAIKYQGFVTTTGQAVGGKEETLRNKIRVSKDQNSYAAFSSYVKQTRMNDQFNGLVESITGGTLPDFLKNGGHHVKISAVGKQGEKILTTRHNDDSTIKFDSYNNGTGEQDFVIDVVNAQQNLVAICAVGTSDKYIAFNDRSAGPDNTGQGYPILKNLSRSDQSTWVRMLPMTDEKGNIIKDKYILRGFVTNLEENLFADFDHDGKLNAASRAIGAWEPITIIPV